MSGFVAEDCARPLLTGPPTDTAAKGDLVPPSSVGVTRPGDLGSGNSSSSAKFSSSLGASKRTATAVGRRSSSGNGEDPGSESFFLTLRGTLSSVIKASQQSHRKTSRIRLPLTG